MSYSRFCNLCTDSTLQFVFIHAPWSVRFLYNFRQNLLRPFVEIKITLALGRPAFFPTINEIFPHKLCTQLLTHAYFGHFAAFLLLQWDIITHFNVMRLPLALQMCKCPSTEWVWRSDSTIQPLGDCNVSKEYDSILVLSHIRFK